jgi:hypothetical protein
MKWNTGKGLMKKEGGLVGKEGGAGNRQDK